MTLSIIRTQQFTQIEKLRLQTSFELRGLIYIFYVTLMSTPTSSIVLQTDMSFGDLTNHLISALEFS